MFSTHTMRMLAVPALIVGLAFSAVACSDNGDEQAVDPGTTAPTTTAGEESAKPCAIGEADIVVLIDEGVEVPQDFTVALPADWGKEQGIVWVLQQYHDETPSGQSAVFVTTEEPLTEQQQVWAEESLGEIADIAGVEFGVSVDGNDDLPSGC